MKTVNIIKTCHILSRNLLLGAVLFLLTAAQAMSAAPTVSGIQITSTGAPYTVGEKIQATVTFSDDVIVTGTPQLTLKVGSAETADRTADYKSGTGTTKLVFEYTVAANDTDTDGIEIEANKLALNNGTIRDTVGNNATLTHSALTTQASHKVDTTKPTVNKVSITSVIRSYFGLGATLQATVTFSENVTVTGTPQLTLKVGTADRIAAYKSGTGTAALVFEYTVAAGDTDTDGIEIEANKLSLNSGTIKDAAGNAATLTHAALGTQTNYKVDGILPTVETVEIVSNAGADKTYATGDKIKVRVTFSEKIYFILLQGLEQWISLTVGTAEEKAYAPLSYENLLTKTVDFEYTVASSDTDTDGISIAANKIATVNHTYGFRDQADNTATDLTHDALAAQASHKVEAVAPTVSSIAITSTAKTYKTDDTIQATVTFSENVTVTGTPQLTLKVGTADKTANYRSGSGTAALVFEYTVAAGRYRYGWDCD